MSSRKPKPFNPLSPLKTVVYPLYREYFYTKQWGKSLLTSSIVGKKIDYEKYFTEGQHSNYDHFWVLGGIPLDFIYEVFLMPRIRQLQKVIKGRFQNKKLLDLGCGDGTFLKLAKQYGLKTYGLDISKNAIKTANTILGVTAYQCNLSAEQIPFPSAYFDIITAFDLVEHVKDVSHLFAEVKRVLKPNGIFYFITPNGRQPADKDETHFSLKRQNQWEGLSKRYFEVISSYTYDYFPPPRFLLIQKLISAFNQIWGIKIQQVVIIARKRAM